MKYEFCIPTLFGLEGIVADELKFNLKLIDVRAENGRVYFSGDEKTLIKANLWLRCGERILLKVGEFKADTFDNLFEGTKALPWENFIEKDGAFPVNGYSLNSLLTSIPDCQSIVKKAIVDRLSSKYHKSWFEETGTRYKIQFSIMKDKAELFIDTSGAGLHKRGYRPQANAAPLRETLAAAMVKISRYKGREMFIDPFCGSGTIAIESALIARNKAPGMLRTFDCEKWNFIDKGLWTQARNECIDLIKKESFPIYASDISQENVDLSMTNADRAGVMDTITFDAFDVKEINFKDKEGTLICNPPYGERLLDLERARKLYSDFGAAVKGSKLKKYIISSDQDFETAFSMKADKKRKLYNGMIKCDLYMYFK